jgi:hypothetical protein
MRLGNSFKIGLKEVKGDRMVIKEINVPRHQDLRVDLSLKDVDSAMEYMAKLLGTLETKINVLPKVDERGDSECPFAEDLYAQKEEEMEKVRKHLEKLRGLLVILENEITRLRCNLSRVQTDGSSLHLESAKERYQSAKQGLEHHINKNQDKKKKILNLMSRAEKMLSLAGAKKWPSGKPKAHKQVPSITSGQTKDFGNTLSSGTSSHSGLSLNTEVKNLFSLGPLGKTGPLLTDK